MRKALCVLFAAALAMVAFLGSSSAASPSQTVIDVSVPATTQDVSALALSCPGGSLCVWPVADGSSSRCRWSSADPDWQGGDVRCSWSGSRAVQASYNNGTSASYAGVCMYPAANYGGNTAYYLNQGQAASGFPGVRIRSHKWVRTYAGCF